MNIAQIQKKTSPIFQEYGVRRAEVFGSVSRGEATVGSDVDILISIGKPMGMFSYMRMKREIESALGGDVDIVTEKSVNKFIRPYIAKELRVIYER